MCMKLRNWDKEQVSFSPFCPASLCEWSSSDVIGPISFIFGRMIGHDVLLIILSFHFDLMIFVGVTGLKHFHAFSI